MATLRKIWFFLQISMAIAVFIFAAALLILFPGLIIADLDKISIFWVLFASIYLVFLWLLFFLVLLDALGYIYGTKRPIFSPILVSIDWSGSTQR